MKKFIKIISPLLLAVVFLFGCSPADDGDIKNPPDGDQKPPVTEELKSAEEVYALLSDSQKKCDKYDLDKYMLPYWNSQVIYNESVIPYRDKSGNIPDRELAFPVAKVLEVRSNDLKTVFEEGKDYVITEEIGRAHV